MKKKKLIFIYREMILGGSTTNLLSVLHELDYSQYDVTLALYNKNSDFDAMIPKEIAQIIYLRKTHSKIMLAVNFCLCSSAWRNVYKVVKERGIKNFFKAVASEMSLTANTRNLEEIYDVAIGCMEGWSDRFVADHVHANKKIMWVHTDIAKAPLGGVMQLEYLKYADYVICISQDSTDSAKKLFPEIKDKIVYVPNVFSPALIKKRSMEDDPDLQNIISYKGFKIISVGRIDNYTKRLDRMIQVSSILKSEGIDFKWYYVGEGKDRSAIENMIKEYNIADNFILLGLKMNPYPFILHSDLLCMMSRYEGKPMVVTEAQILGIPPIVTEYSAAYEQIKNGVTGFVVPDCDDFEFAKQLAEIASNQDILDKMKRGILKIKTDYSEGIDYFTNLL